MHRTLVDDNLVRRARDLVALAKPRVTMLVLLTTLGGAWLAPTPLARVATIALLVGTSLIVSGANALNMFLERDTDRLMSRTKDRPLPSGRMSARLVLRLGIVSSAIAIPVLVVGVNATTAVLAGLANLLYVLAYTPLKRRTHAALFVGAVPGAIPPLLGWTAATGRVEMVGLVLFGILYFWQLPHFHAIALFRREEYARAGLEVAPSRLGVAATRAWIMRAIVAVSATSTLLVPLRVVRSGYLPVALALGAAFFAVGWIDGRRQGTGRATFLASLAYLVMLIVALVLFAA